MNLGEEIEEYQVEPLQLPAGLPHEVVPEPVQPATPVIETPVAP